MSAGKRDPGGGVDDHHEGPGFLELGEVIGSHPLPRDDDGRDVERPGPRERGRQIAGRAERLLGRLPVVVAAVDDRRQRERVEITEEMRSAPAALKCGGQGEALVQGSQPRSRRAVAPKENGPTSRVHAHRSCTTRGRVAGWCEGVVRRDECPSRRASGARAGPLDTSSPVGRSIGPFRSAAGFRSGSGSGSIDGFRSINRAGES